MNVRRPIALWPAAIQVWRTLTYKFQLVKCYCGINAFYNSNHFFLFMFCFDCSVFVQLFAQSLFVFSLA